MWKSNFAGFAMSLTTPDLTTTLGPLQLKNPVLTASGTFGYGLEYEPLVDLNAWGPLWSKGCR
jgi:dihydroorotate dehydrogenase (NAD+) catalytic subunit